jgi:hypothetical protein
MRTGIAQLVLASDRLKVAPLDPARPLTIGTSAANRLCLSSAEGVSEHHAVVRFSRSHGWLVCDWKSRDGTYLEGQRIQRCRPLSDGDEIRLGREGPALRFELKQIRPPSTQPAARGAPLAVDGKTTGIDFDGQMVPFVRIQSATVLSRPHHPHIFSWWLLLCLGGLLLLPFPLLFWPLQLMALAGWLLLGSRKDHDLVVILHDGQALRHRFANRSTALAHRNGIRHAIGQSLEPS